VYPEKHPPNKSLGTEPGVGRSGVTEGGGGAEGNHSSGFVAWPETSDPP
jgi:hypothetical protein